MTTISIALATFNGQRFLGDQLRSLAEQETLPGELVIADDASSDDTIAMLREFARSAPFLVRIFRNEVRLGYRANFVRIAAECTGDLIAFCDQDDVWDRRKLGQMRKTFADPDVLLAYHNSRLVNDAGTVTGTIYSHRRRSKAYEALATRPWQVIPGHTQVMRRSLNRFNELHPASIDPFTPNALAPYDDWYQFWATVLGKMAYVSEVLVDYRQHADSASGWPFPTWRAYLAEHIANAETYAICNVDGATNRLKLLDRARDFMNNSERHRVDAAVQAYRALSHRYVQRSKIYQERRMIDRARGLLAPLKEGAYFSSGHHGLGLDTLLLDAFIGVFCGSLGRRSPAAP